jgi:NAD(P)-dependent dehydrogenase (short-subunit alcohol dehydrogenase family)
MQEMVMRERVGRVEGKVAMVTGAGSIPGPGVGTGKAISIALAREGAKLVLVDLFPERAEETKQAIEAEGGEAIVVKADCTKWRDCSNMVLAALDAFGRVDILVNNLGLASPGTVTEMYERDWDRVFDINLRTVFLACKYTIPVMLAQQSGSVINLSSLSAQRPGRTVAYTASKAGVEAMTFDMAYAYGRKGVRVNCVLPGNINTPIATNVLKAFPGHEQMQKLRERGGMLGIPGDAWDIAHAVVYLASEEARFVTGVTLPVDAGMLRTTAMSMVNEIRTILEEEAQEGS